MSDKFVPQGDRPWPTQRDIMMRLKGYQEIMNRPELRRRISELVLLAAKPEMVKYSSVAEQIERESGLKCTTAYDYILGGHRRTEKFVFDNLVKDDPVYQQFCNHKGFRAAFLAAVERFDALPDNFPDFSDKYPLKVEAVVAAMQAQYGMDVRLFAKFYLGAMAHRKMLTEIATS